jgi:hypothetical protein
MIEAAFLDTSALKEIEFAIVIIALGLLLFLREILYTMTSEKTRLKLIVNIIIIPFFLLFLFNWAIIFINSTR